MKMIHKNYSNNMRNLLMHENKETNKILTNKKTKIYNYKE